MCVLAPAIRADAQDAVDAGRAVALEPAFSHDNSTTSTTVVDIADPIRYWNAVWFHFNDKCYFWVFKPVSVVWRYAIYPEAPRCGLHNAVDNLGFPGRFVNCSLQGRFRDAGVESLRFLTNTTLGVAGVWDPAEKWFDLEARPANVDQTFHRWKIGRGFYIVLPLMGGGSPRGLVAGAGDMALSPLTYLGVGGLGIVFMINDLSLGLSPYEEIVKRPPSPYIAMRRGYAWRTLYEAPEDNP